MRRLVLSLLTTMLFAICFPVGSLAQSASPEATVTDFVKAWNLHERKGFDRLFSDDAIFVPVAETRHEGRADIVEDFTQIHKGWAKSTTVALTSAIKVHTVRPDVAVVFCHLGFLDEQGKPVPNIDRAMLFIVVRQPDGWRITAGQLTKQSAT